ncbi:MAG: basic amino acid/polyamine antiporter, family [Acidobacteriota bacterium]|jgi:APA family basic amino acid/polyamine antiporter|nr:basic amino acid/polyamine antiporter, family [Acidobacteriota bacterium]
MSAADPVSHAQARRLLTVLGVGFGLAVTVGNIIGAGILRTPGEIAGHLPRFAPFIAVWIIGGLYALLGANSLAELGSIVPKSGGQYVFVRRALGDYPAFIVGWSDWISTCGTTAFVAIVIGEHARDLFPHTVNSIGLVALIVIGALTIVQWFGVKWGSGAQNVTSVLKALAFLILIAACFRFGARNPMVTSFETEPETSMLLAFVLALQAVIYTYDGWTAVIYFSEEVKNPGKNIPRSMFGGVISVIVIYLLVNIAFLCVVPLGSLAGEKRPAGVVARHLFGPYGDTVLLWITLVALLSALNSNVLMAPRVILAMGRDRLFWRGATEVNRGGTPDIALLISSALAVAFVMSGRVESILAVLAFFFVVNYTLSFVSLFVLRRREPDIERPFRAWGHPFTTGLALVASVAFLIGAIMSDTRMSIYALVILGASVPIYFLMKLRTT